MLISILIGIDLSSSKYFETSEVTVRRGTLRASLVT